VNEIKVEIKDPEGNYAGFYYDGASLQLHFTNKPEDV